MRIYHVTTNAGHVYGVAATGKREAMLFVQERLSADGDAGTPERAEVVGSGCWPYGTVLAY